MGTQFLIQVQDKPGEFSKIAEQLGKKNINIEGLGGYSTGGKFYLNIYTNNPSETESTLNSLGVSFEKQDAVEIKLQDRPGGVAGFAKELASNNINITSFLVTTSGNEVLSTNNYSKTTEIAKKQKVLVEAAGKL